MREQRLGNPETGTGPSQYTILYILVSSKPKPFSSNVSLFSKCSQSFSDGVSASQMVHRHEKKLPRTNWTHEAGDLEYLTLNGKQDGLGRWHQGFVGGAEVFSVLEALWAGNLMKHVLIRVLAVWSLLNNGVRDQILRLELLLTEHLSMLTDRMKQHQLGTAGFVRPKQ